MSDTAHIIAETPLPAAPASALAALGRQETALIVALIGLATVILFAADSMPALRGHVPASLATPLHTLFELLYVAAVTAIGFTAWHAPRGAHRLRAVFAASLLLPGAGFDVVHLLSYPGMPDLDIANSRELSFYASRLSRLMLPAAFLVLALVPRSLALPSRLRWSVLSATLAMVLPVAWLGLTNTADLPALQTDVAGITRHMTATRWLTIALYLFVAFVAVHSRADLDRRDARRLFAAALLIALGEACIGAAAGGLSPLNAFGHAAEVLGLVAAFIAVYGDAIGAPYRDMEQSRAAAVRDKERSDATFRAIADGVVVVDRNLALTELNPVARHLLAQTGTPVLGTSLAQALSALDPSAREALIDDVEACLHNGRSRCSGNNARTWEIADTRIAVAHKVSPVVDPAGRVQGAVLALHNVTEQRRLQDDLRDTADYARSLFEASPDPMIGVDTDGVIAEVNRAAEAVAGMSRSELVGSDFAERFADPHAARLALNAVYPDGTVRDQPLVAVKPDGTTTELSCNITAYRTADGEIRGAIVIARDVTDMRQVQLQLQFQATCDALTALPNRRLYRERIERAMPHSRRNGTLAGVLIIDIDDFKDINDALGHNIGDEIIKGIATRLVYCLREIDTVARIGGDEFGVLVEGIADAANLQPLADKLLNVVTAPFYLDGGEVTVTCSIGAAIFPIDAADPDTLVRHADTALYRAKDAGKNTSRFFTADMNAAVQRRLDLGSRLRNALARQEFMLHYQPQVDLASGRVVGVEALLRWNAEGLGPVSPMEFIPIAEDSGLIVAIGDWALREACRQAESWRRELGQDISVAVNLSARQFRDDIAAAVHRALAESGLPPQLLELELTESLLVRDPVRVAETLTGLKRCGVRIAVDDFGTGYSSLAYLRRFPLDYLKVDRSFVMDVPGERNAEAIVRSIVSLAHSLGLKVIAEGVENVEQMAFLRELGCNEMQGYYVSPPRPAAELHEFIVREAAVAAVPHLMALPEESPAPCFSMSL